MTEPTTAAGRALLDSGSFPDDEGPPIWWSLGDLSPDEMRRRILAIEAEARQQDASALREALTQLLVAAQHQRDVSPGAVPQLLAAITVANEALAALPEPKR